MHSIDKIYEQLYICVKNNDLITYNIWREVLNETKNKQIKYIRS